MFHLIKFKMHPEAIHFMKWAKSKFPQNFSEGVRVLDVGGGDVNGNNRYLFDGTVLYESNDVVDAPNVTVVSKTSGLAFQPKYFDTIISTECFEHDPELQASLAKIVELLKDDGVFAFTCASTGRNEHGTRRTSAQDSYGTKAGMEEMQDFYHNVTVEDIACLLQVFRRMACFYNSHSKDLYFVGVKGIEHGGDFGFFDYEAPGVHLLVANYFS